jgi:hypothetical protein
MTTLDDAWEWYRAASEGMKRLRHLALYWGQAPERGDNVWVDRLLKDSVLGSVEATQMGEDATAVLGPLDDLAVLVLFSVFEANVRDMLIEQLLPEMDRLTHPVLVKSAQDLVQVVAEGSFFKVLEPFKSSATNDLIEHVNQVRRYRNWVAHGRRAEKKPDSVQPKAVYQRLKEFLSTIRAVGI